MPWDPAESACFGELQRTSGQWFTWHGFFAVSFFLSITAVCLLCAGYTLPLIPSRAIRQRYVRVYNTLGVLMIVSPLAAWLYSLVSRQREARVFYMETFAILTFAAYWMVKSMEIRMTASEEWAARGQLSIADGQARR